MIRSARKWLWRFAADLADGCSDCAELLFQLTARAKAQVFSHSRFKVGCFEFDPVGVLCQPPCLGRIRGVHGCVAALGQDQADPIDDVRPRPHRRDASGSISRRVPSHRSEGKLRYERRHLDVLCIRDVELCAQWVTHLMPDGEHIVPGGNSGQAEPPIPIADLKPTGSG